MNIHGGSDTSKQKPSHSVMFLPSAEFYLRYFPLSIKSATKRTNRKVQTQMMLVMFDHCDLHFWKHMFSCTIDDLHFIINSFVHLYLSVPLSRQDGAFVFTEHKKLKFGFGKED